MRRYTALNWSCVSFFLFLFLWVSVHQHPNQHFLVMEDMSVSGFVDIYSSLKLPVLLSKKHIRLRVISVVPVKMWSTKHTLCCDYVRRFVLAYSRHTNMALRSELCCKCRLHVNFCNFFSCDESPYRKY